ncbi:MAG: hypothetical protein Q8S09_06080 [Hyphomonas sp.]|nr:hypothetical protein [Hyphomonas sp.]
MILAVSLLGLIPAAADMCSVTQSAFVELDSREVRLSDIVEAGSAACLTHVAGGELLIAALAGHETRATLARGQLAATARQRVPGLNISCGDAQACARPVELIVRRETAGDGATGCVSLAVPKARGAVIEPADLDQVSCAPEPAEAALRYDPEAGALRAAAPLAAGTYLGRIRPGPAPRVLSGDQVVVATYSGPVRIEQPATVLQSARQGDGVFVQTASGAVLSVSVPPAKETIP